MKAPGQVTFKRVIVTNKPVLGKTVRQLGFEAKYGVSVTRLQRGGVEMMATSDVRLQFGDVLIIVGDARALEQVAAELGNSPKQLDETNFIPVFFGIVLGIIAGSLPIALPGSAGARAARPCRGAACPRHPACPCRQYRTARLVHAGQC